VVIIRAGYLTLRADQRGGDLLDAVRADGAPAGTFNAKLEALPRLVILVHGYNTPQHKAIARYDQITTKLHDIGVPDHRLASVWWLYWPGDRRWRATSTASFPWQIERSLAAAERLGAFLDRLSPDKEVVLVAHSLGSRLVLEAAEQVAHNRRGGELTAICLMAAAVPVALCEGSGAYRARRAQVEYVLHSRHDTVLSRVFRIGSWLGGDPWSEAVGRNGFPDERWGYRVRTELGHNDYYGDLSSVTAVARLLGIATTRIGPPSVMLPEASLVEWEEIEPLGLPERWLGMADIS